MKTIFKQTVSFVLTLAFLAGIVSNSFIGFAVSDDISLDDIESFGSALADIITEAEANLDKTKHNDEDVVAQGIEKDFEATRLIVKSDSNLDDMGAVSKVEGLLGLHIFQYKNAGAATLAYQHYLNNKNVDWVEYDETVTASSVTPTVDEEWLTLSGANHLSWGADYMGIDAFLEDLDKDSLENVVVAVADTGIDTDHPIFGGYYDENENPDGRILKDGKNFSESKNDVPYEDDNGHGTHVSGTIVDLTLSNVKILPLKILDSFGYGYTSSIASAILYAAYGGADVVNMSLGGMDYDSFVNEYVIDIAYDMGCVVIAAAGNEYSDASWSSPGLLEKCITVGSLDETLSLSEFSNYGTVIDVCAPGEYIISANMGGGYISFDGTSMAAPHVSALAALYLSKDPSLDAFTLSETITSDAVDLGEDGKDFLYGYGLAFAKADSLRNLGTIKVEYSSKPFAHVINDFKPDFVGPVDVTLSCDGSDSIYFTIDGTNPLTSKTAQLYSEKIHVDHSLKLRAVALNNSKQPGRSVPLMRYVFIGKTAPEYRLFTNGNTIVAATGLLPSEYTVPSGYTTVGDYAFANHHEIEKLSFSDSITTVSEGGFLRCELSSLDLNRVKNIGSLSFAYGSETDLSSDELVTIGDYAFAHNSFPDLSFPNVKELGNYAFCYSLIAEISLPELKTIGNHAFLATEFLYDYYNPNKNTFYAPKTETIGDYAFFGSMITSLDFPKATKIGKYAFANSFLTSINLPLMENIDDYTFFGSYYLQSFDIPKLKTVGDFAFAGCFVENESAFSLVESVGESTFYYIAAPNGLSMPNLVHAGNNAFESAEIIGNLSLPKLKTAGDYSFARLFYESEEPFSLPELESAGDYSFAYNDFFAFNAPKLKTIGNCAFMYTSGVSKISLPVVESIGSMAFLHSSLNTIKLHDNVKFIGARAFNDSKIGIFPTTTKIIANKGTYCEKYALENGYEFVALGTVFTVTFRPYRGNRTLSVQQVSAGDAATAPKAPFRLGMKFVGWNCNISCVASDLEVRPVYESIFEGFWDRIIFFFLDLFGFIYY